MPRLHRDALSRTNLSLSGFRLTMPSTCKVASAGSLRSGVGTDRGLMTPQCCAVVFGWADIETRLAMAEFPALGIERQGQQWNSPRRELQSSLAHHAGSARA